MDIGIVRGRLKPCRDSPNCVGSMYPQDEKHYMKPWFYHLERSEVIEHLLDMIRSERGTEIKEVKENYIHAVYTIPFFGYKDDLEFYMPDSGNVIHFRSASRVGYYDFGVNKRRINRLRKKLANLSIVTI